MEIIEMKSKKNINRNTKVEFDISYKGSFDAAAKTLNYHYEGIRELLKNSGSAMLRAGKDENNRNCVLLFRDKGGKEKKSLIGFLDFVGMDRDRVSKAKKLNSTTAGLDDKLVNKNDLWAGHGNGGKVYGAKFFDKSLWITSLDNKLNIFGYESNIVSKNSHFSDLSKKDVGFLIDEEKPLGNPEQKLRSELKRFKIDINNLPKEIQDFMNAKSFTLFIGENPIDHSKNIKKKDLINDLIKDSEALEPLNFVNLYAIHNGKLLKEKTNDSYIFEPEKFIPHKDFEKPRTFKIPDTLEDPVSGKMIDFSKSNIKELVIRSWDKDFTKARNKRHFIRGRLSEGVKATVGRIKVSELTPHTLGFPRHLYGDVFHDELWKYASNTRGEFNDSPFINALKNWIAQIINEIAEEFQKKNEDQIGKKSQENIQQFSEKLEEIIKQNKFLQNPFGINKGNGKSPDKKDGEEDEEDENDWKKKVSDVDEIKLSLFSKYCGIGVTFRPNVKCLNKYGYEVKNPRLEFIISNNKIVNNHERKLNLLYAVKEGEVTLQVKELRNNKLSNKVELSVKKISLISFDKKVVSVKERSKLILSPICVDENGKNIDKPYLTYISNDIEIADTASTGMIIGRQEGKTEVSAMTHDCESKTIKVEVLYNEKRNDNKGGFPDVKYSGIDPDPLLDGSEEPVLLSADAPPVYQRLWDQEAGIWWINLQSPIANKLFKTKNRGIAIQDGEKSKQFRMYIILQWFEIMGRINVLNSKDDPPETMEDFKRLTDLEITKFHKIMEPHIDLLMSSDIFNIK